MRFEVLKHCCILHARIWVQDPKWSGIDSNWSLIIRGKDFETYGIKIQFSDNSCTNFSSLNSVSLAMRLSSENCGAISTRNSRAVTRTVSKILKLAKDLPESERTDTFLLQYFSTAVQNVEFARTAQITLLADKNTTIERLNLSILTDAQLEDNFKLKIWSYEIHLVKQESDDDSDYDEDSEDLFDQNFVDRLFAHRNRKCFLICGDNKKQNRTKNNAVKKFFDRGSTRHLAFHKECVDTDSWQVYKAWYW